LSGRQYERVRRRVTADVRVGDKHLKGLIVDLSPGELFVQMEAATLPDRGIEVELELAESRFGPAMTLRGEVVRRSLASAVLGQLGARGVGIRLVEAPPEFHEAFGDDGAGPVPDPDRAAHCENSAVGVDVEIGADADIAEVDLPAPVPATRGEAWRDLPSPAPAVPTESDRPAEKTGDAPGHSLLNAPGASEVPGVPGATAAPVSAAPSELPVSVEPEGLAQAELEALLQDEPEREASELGGLETDLQALEEPASLVLPPDADDPRHEVWCVYDGDELDDVYQELEALGARPQRAGFSGPTRFVRPEMPPRIVITPALESLHLELPDAERGQTVRIAVADTTSQVLGGVLARIGYRYLIRRPVSPELLRLLLRGLLYEDEEARRHERHAAGWPVQLRIGWRTLSATLLDLSGGGARLLTRGQVDLLAEVRLRIPRTSQQRAVSLPGRVIRKRAHPDGSWSLALRFLHDVDFPTLEALQRRLECGAIGPAPGPAEPLVKRLLAWWRKRVSAWTPSAEQSAPTEPPERRRQPRVELDREVLDLDPETRVPRYVLVGRDLSAGGLRVEPHPELRLDEILSLALFDAHGAPLELSARVARDDGERGWVLEFEELGREASTRLAELIESLPRIELLDERESRRVVFARIATDRVEANQLAR
jgi:hypothetical protein